jgi:predicted metal-binding membrane protein
MASTRRFPGGVHSPLTVADLPRPSRRARVIIAICLVLIVALAWAYLVHLDRQMSSSMDYDMKMAAMGMTMDRPWAVADLFYTFTMWAVMMVGMMAGTAAPVLFLFAAMQVGRGEPGVRLGVVMFGLGYIAVWTGFSACATLAQWALREATLLSPAMVASSPILAGGILIVAGAYQLTPFKGSCLRQCRSPLGFLMTNWRDGVRGALEMGLRHGVHCLGCCWALMCVLFVVGVMNLAWVAALTVFVLVEKIGPAGLVVSRIAGAAMIVAGALFVIGLP